MAVRRGFNDAGDFSDDPYQGFGGPAMSGLDNLFGLSGEAPMADAGAGDGQLPPEMFGSGNGGGSPLTAPPPAATRGDDSAGNIDRARELFPSTRPTDYTGGGLPQGVVAQREPASTSDFSAGAAPSNAFQTALSPPSPSPIAMQGQPASTAAPERGTGPQRPGFTGSESALFGTTPGQAGLFGGAGGLNEGGYGVFGVNDGAPKPTEMMLALLKQLQRA